MNMEKQKLYVEVKSDKSLREAFRAARYREQMSSASLATMADSNEHILKRYENGQKFFPVDVRDGLLNAHKLLGLDLPAVGEPFEYTGQGLVSGFKYKKGAKKAVTKHKYVNGKAVPVMPKALQPDPIEVLPKSNYNIKNIKALDDIMVLMDLERRGIITSAAAKDAIYSVLKENH